MATFLTGQRLTADALNNFNTEITNRRLLFDQRTADSGSITGTSLTTVLTVTVPSTGDYAFSLLATLTNTSAVGRPGFGTGGTSTISYYRWASQTIHYNSATATQGFSGTGTAHPSVGDPIVNSDFTTTTGFSAVQIQGKITVSAAGTLAFRFSEASGSGTVTIKAGSSVSVQMMN